jgi:hypothetical protein
MAMQGFQVFGLGLVNRRKMIHVEGVSQLIA